MDLFAAGGYVLMGSRAMVAIINEWLPHIGGRPEAAPEIAEQVAEQIRALPTPIRLGVGSLERALSVVPGGSINLVQHLPGAEQYIRLVRSLTTVVFFADQDGRR